MPSVLILCAHRPGRSPSQRYRFEQYLPYLQEQGFHFTFSYLLNEKGDSLFYSKGHTLLKIGILLKSLFIRLKDLLRFKSFDIIFIQREALFFGTSFVERRAAASEAYVIFDFDDSIWLADTSPGNKKWEWIKKPEKLFDTLGKVQAVIAGNSYLANKALAYNKNTFVIPTTINTDIHIPKPQLRNSASIRIGWTGSISTVKHFELVVPVLMKIQDRYGDKVHFVLFGDKNYSNPHLHLRAMAWTEQTEVDIINSFDIGLMPLPNNEWAKGKCGLKGLSYMACGVPTLMSAVGVNTEIIQDGHNGYLIHSEAEWYDRLCMLIENESLRKQIGNKGRETVIEKYSVKANKQLYLQVFQRSGQNA